MWVQLDYKRTFGRTPTWGDVRDRLERFDPEHLINFISYLSLMIYPDDRCTAPVVQLALIHARGSIRPSGVNLQGLGEALLMMNDLCDFGYRLHAANDVEGALVASFTAMSTFYHSDNPVHRFARYFGLFLEGHPHLANAPNYIDLPVQCRALMGLDPQAVWTFAFATYARWLADEGLPPIDGRFCITDAYFDQLLAGSQCTSQN